MSELKLPNAPIAAFEKWLQQAVSAGCSEPTAMTLATASKLGVPSARIVLFKGLRGEAFRFFTNYQSPKAHDLIENPIASLVFFWSAQSFQRQIRVFGSIEKLSEKESTEYFHSRARGSQIGAWASPQSQKVKSREALEEFIKEYEKKFDGKTVDRPPYWGGFVLNPEKIEFWEGREFRVHERFLFEKINSNWIKNRLAP